MGCLHFGVPPSAIDLILKLKGLDFDKSNKNSIIPTNEELKIKVVCNTDLINAKKAQMQAKKIRWSSESLSFPT